MKNEKEWYEEWVNPCSKECLELFDEIGCKDCLPIDRNRVRFSKTKPSLLNKQIMKIWESDKDTTYKDRYGEQIGMRCPLDCAIRENGIRYELIKEKTRHIKLKRAIRKHMNNNKNILKVGDEVTNGEQIGIVCEAGPYGDDPFCIQVGEYLYYNWIDEYGQSRYNKNVWRKVGGEKYLAIGDKGNKTVESISNGYTFEISSEINEMGELEIHETRLAEDNESRSWSRWFAWYPVKLENDGCSSWVWLRWVLRRKYRSGFAWCESWWIYKEIENK